MTEFSDSIHNWTLTFLKKHYDSSAIKNSNCFDIQMRDYLNIFWKINQRQERIKTTKKQSIETTQEYFTEKPSSVETKTSIATLK